MNPLHHDLARLTRGEVFTDPVRREAYATAACIYRIVPRAVVRPAEAAEIAPIVAYASERGIPVTARGAGSAVAGQALGAGIIIDFSAHLARVLAINVEKREAIVEPGIILEGLNRELRNSGLMFPPDPSSGEYATIGGMIANNSSGAHSLKYGDTRKWTRRLKAVLSDGSVTWLEQKPALPPGLARSDVLENRIYAGLPELLAKYAAAIERSRPRVPKNSSGYHVWDLVQGRDVDPAPLIVGSEGTLAVVIKAALALAPVPAARSAALLLFSSLDHAGEAVAKLMDFKPAALEIMDHLFIAMVREHRPGLGALLPESARALLLIEFEADTEGEARSMIESAGRVVADLHFSGFSMAVAASDAEIERLFAVRKAASPILYALPGRRLTRFVEDVVIPPERLAEGITTIQSILKQHGTDAPVLGHAGSGNLHLNPRLNLEHAADRERMRAIAEDVYAAVIGMGGSITGEHGDGMLRAPYVKRQFPELYPLFKEIKTLFDPANILNPGKVLAEGDRVPAETLRFGDAEAGGSISGVTGNAAALIEMLLRCHGCGLCRTYCPVFSATADEMSLPRAKVSLLRAAMLGDIDPDAPGARDEFLRLLNLCTGCQRCVTGCPTGIEPYLLISSFLDDHYQRHGRPLRERIFARAPSLLALRSRAPRPLTSIIEGPAVRALMGAALGIRRDAPLPSPSPWERPSGRDSSGRTVLYYPGCLGRYADAEQETRAAIAALGLLGFNVITPELPCCGMAKLSAADVEGARGDARRLLAALGDYLEQGVPIITACPSCALAFRHEYAALVGEESSRLAALAHEFFEFIAREIAEKSDTMFSGARLSGNVVLHRPCQQAALSSVDHVADVLAQVPGLTLTMVDACCGLAGFHGMRAQNAPLTRALASVLTEAVKKNNATRVISSCPGCRAQIRALGLEPISAVVLLHQCLSPSGTIKE